MKIFSACGLKNPPRSFLVLVVALLPACFIARGDGGPVEPGPEQFVFSIVPGGGRSEAANQALEGMANNVEDADHRASVETPMGRLDIYRYTEVQDGETWSCESVLGPNSASASCGNGGPPASPTSTPTPSRQSGRG